MDNTDIKSTTNSTELKLWLIVCLALYVALDYKLLFEPAGGINFIKTFLKLLIPTKVIELILFLVIVFIGCKLFFATRSKPYKIFEAPSVKFRSLKEMSSKINLSMGWSLTWRLFLLMRLLAVPKELYIRNTSFIDIYIVFEAVFLWVLALLIAKRLTLKRYNQTLSQHWSFMWRFAAGYVTSFVIFLLMNLVMQIPLNGGGETFDKPLILLDWFTLIPALLICQSAFSGWAIHKPLEFEKR